jgi:valyl-tRNA synthetase
MIKPAYQQPIDRETLQQSISIFGKLLKLLHPFMPFITEEIWHILYSEKQSDIMVSEFPKVEKYNENIITRFGNAIDEISAVRTFRKEKNIPQKENIVLLIKTNSTEADTLYDPVIAKLCNISELVYITDKPEGNLYSFVIKSTEFYIPVKLSDEDKVLELKKLQEELEYTQKFLKQVEGKLSNERFVASAPANVVELEYKKKSDAESKIKVIEQKIKELQ